METVSFFIIAILVYHGYKYLRNRNIHYYIGPNKNNNKTYLLMDRYIYRQHFLVQSKINIFLMIFLQYCET